MITKNKIDQFMFINSLQITVNQLSFKTILFRDLRKINSIAETNTVRTRFGGDTSEDKVVTKLHILCSR